MLGHSEAEHRQIVESLHSALSVLEHDDYDEALRYVESALAIERNVWQSIHLLGLIAAKMDEPARAIELFDTAHKLSPRAFEPIEALAITYAKLGSINDSLFFGKLSVASKNFDSDVGGLVPDWFGSFEEHFSKIEEKPYQIQARKALQEGRDYTAVDLLRRSLGNSPDDQFARRELVGALLRTGQPSEALGELRKLFELEAAEPEDFSFAGKALMRLGRYEESLSLHERALESLTDPIRIAKAISAKADDVSRLPVVTASDIEALEREWADAAGKVVSSTPPSPKTTDRDRIRVGLFTGRAYEGGGIDTLLSVLINAPTIPFDIYMYYDNRVHTPTTRRLAAIVERWTDTLEIDSVTLERIVRNDGIDVAIDLDGHRDGGRPELFLRCVAPVTLRYLGMPGSCEVQGIDAVLGEGYLYQGMDGSSRLLEVEGGMVLGPVTRAAHRPARISDHVTYGISTGRDALSGHHLDLMAAIVKRIPNVRIRVNGVKLGGRDVVDEVREAVGTIGGTDAIEVTGFDPTAGAIAQNYQFFQDIDVLVQLAEEAETGDAYGALRQGIPVVVQPGSLPERRLSAAMLRTSGLEDFVAPEIEGIVDILERRLSTSDGVSAANAEIQKKLSSTAVNAAAERQVSALADAIGRALNDKAGG